eukprot:1394425-Amorphochlora_amoeboformis.AAC.1
MVRGQKTLIFVFGCNTSNGHQSVDFPGSKPVTQLDVLGISSRVQLGFGLGLGLRFGLELGLGLV